jgi:eukaryotic-like serine/threonine-protein kinase
MAEGWTKDWERRIVNGVYPLRRFLGQSDHSVVFLTEYQAHSVAQAVIKILPPDPALAEAQLAHWQKVATLSHPHLIRLLDAGRCQLGGHDFLFVVMEYAEETLAQILPGRALVPDEVRELLPATLDALAYLHGQNLVHGGLKPPNFLVVRDQLKLASDTIRPAGERAASSAPCSLYDPPEAKNGPVSAAGDLWGLGITLVEALTQTPPAWSRERSESVSLPANLAPEFVETVRRCLNRDAGQRPTIAELLAHFEQPPPATPPSPATSPSAAAPVPNEPSVRTPSTQNVPKRRFLVRAITVGIITVGAAWTGVHFIRTRTHVPQTASTTPLPPLAVSPPAAVESPRAGIATAPPTVLHQEIPDVSRSARESIRGVIKIAVRVSVDRSGNVAAATLDHRASSKYFARAALDAAKKWKFAQAADQATRVWLLHFEFTRARTTAHAAALR